MYHDILSAEFWSQHIALSPEAMQEVQCWKESFDDCRGQPIWKTDPRIDVIAYSDASDSGWGGYRINVAGSWSEAQQGELNMEGTQRNETGAYVCLWEN